VTLPGPSGVAWALGLLAWAVAAAIVGDLVRTLAARKVGSFRSLEAIERLLLDFYLGGATMYLLAALPIGAFEAPVVYGLPVAATALLVVRAYVRRRARTPSDLPRVVRSALRPAPLLVLASALGLFLFELAVALPIPTGNTYDSSLLTLYVSLLLQHHTIPLSFQPYAPVGLLYPQATTVWLGWAQLVFSLPPARTALLVTPLFFALVPLGAFVFGRRAFGSERAGLGFALFLAAVGSWTRVLVAGSNDFIFAFPLVLWLAGESFAWLRGTVPAWPDVLAFGILVGYSAAMNPVGAEWLLPALLLAGLFVRPAFAGAAGRWIARWAVVAGTSLVAIVPTLYVLALGRSSPELTPGAGAAPAGATSGITGAQFAGSIDPYLFHANNVWLSPVPFLRLELAVLLTVGIAILVLAPRRSAVGQYIASFRTFVVAAFGVLVVLLGLLWAASTGFGPATRLADVTSASELSIWLFTLYTLLGGLGLVLLLEWVTALSRTPREADAPSPPRRARSPRRLGVPRGTVALLLILVIVVPGVALTPTALPSVLTDLYQEFGNVTAADFALLEYAGSHLPTGARVLVAPGSAAEFLPGYARDLVLLYPLVPGWEWINASYRTVVSQLTNATLNTTGESALADLGVQYIVVTGNNTILWPAFSPVPLLADPSAFPLLWSEGDAYLFERTGA
jgi:hypothetical protein